MDMTIISNFLKELRKEKELTQEQLGEMIGVTNKTISRWENGNYMPPIDCLKKLSEIYKISINEIIAGKRISDEDYKINAEENITRTINDVQINNKRIEKSLTIMMYITTVLAILTIIIIPKEIISFKKIQGILIIVFVCLLAFVSNTINLIAICLLKINK